MGKKLTKLNLKIDKRFLISDKKFTQKKKIKDNWFTEHVDFIPAVLTGAAMTAGTAAGIGAVAGVTMGASTALTGGDVDFTKFSCGGLVACSSALMSMVNAVKATCLAKNSREDAKTSRKIGVALLLASVLASFGPCRALGNNIGAGTHKITTAIIDKLKVKHQIEQTVKPEEPALIFDESQARDV